MKFKKWVEDNFVPFKLPDFDGSYSHFKPLNKIIDNTRVVALGENSHFIKEFFLLRHDLIRYFIEELGFTTFAFEFGFAEAFSINSWIQGQGADDEIREHLEHFYYPEELHNTFRWLREYNRSAKHKITFLGIDVPKNGGSYFPNLSLVQDFFEKTDREALHLIEDIKGLVKELDLFSTSQAAIKLQDLTEPEKHLLTYKIARVKQRLEVMAPSLQERYGKKEFEKTLQLINGMVYQDYNIQAMANFISGVGTSGDEGSRDKYMADTVLWHLNSSDPGTKILLVAHNAHIQKTPFYYEGFLSCFPMGQRLKYALGNDYMALGMTSYAGNTAALYPEKDSKFGFRVDNFQLEQAKEGSVEKALKDAGVTNAFVSFKDFRGDDPSIPNLIRFDTIYTETNLKEAFDGVFQMEKSTVSEVVFE
ncbi:erythromycin esterase family protein [Pleomorphovibrio marinus]|uniref:erythromycin esterase family protein n=1 Tax=Pleomorphovibrio marinus TaxID=2164132 RepID=UPI000E0A7ACC|nr:erythromycin esterase family protein [Pleomorphovibrio marinus]